MNWRRNMHWRRVRQEHREAVPLVVRKEFVKKENKVKRTALLAAALLLSFGLYYLIYVTTVVPEEGEGFIVGVTAIRSPEEEKEKEDVPPPPPPPPPPQGVGEGWGTGMGDGSGETEKKSIRRTMSENQEIANQSGILGALSQGSESLEAMFDETALGDLDKNLEGMIAVSGIDKRGVAGLGIRGAGLGGGGGSLGIGGLGTRGRGGGGRGGSKYGMGAAGNLNKRSGNIDIQTGAVTMTGGLDKSVIARIIRKHYSQIRYCYQKELNKNPTLEGKITVAFTISPTGAVSQSAVKVTTMKNQQVEDCVAMVIKRIMFPKPKGGGIVVVTYPFIFRAEGA